MHVYYFGIELQRIFQRSVETFRMGPPWEQATPCRRLPS